MAKHSWERARWKRREARRRLEVGGWWTGWFPLFASEQDKEEWQQRVRYVQKRLEGSVHGCMSEATRVRRRGWRRAGREICRLHTRGAHDEAESLDPQPRRLGVMWDIW
ncbi:hypothetical protein Dalu01_03057 [Deinococcus aluminii]|uniref:Uncharacterized protein n=1 Tax=Deinococcus aluminii TaxID=1656885 RepID=A0ABP9XH08_9DEIO